MLFPSYLPFPPLPLPCLACLFVCLCRAECAAAAAAEHALLAALANCCLLSSNARECMYIYMYVCVCLCVCAGVLTLYKLLIIMSPSECHHDLHESFSLAWFFLLSPVKESSRYHIYSIYIYLVCIHGNWQVALSGYACSLCAGCRRRRRRAVSALLSPPSLLLALIRLTFSFYT